MYVKSVDAEGSYTERDVLETSIADVERFARVLGLPRQLQNVKVLRRVQLLLESRHRNAHPSDVKAMKPWCDGFNGLADLILLKRRIQHARVLRRRTRSQQSGKTARRAVEAARAKSRDGGRNGNIEVLTPVDAIGLDDGEVAKRMRNFAKKGSDGRRVDDAVHLQRSDVGQRDNASGDIHVGFYSRC